MTEPSSLLLHGMQDTLAQQWEACPTISLPFDEFEPGDMAFEHAIIDPPGEPGPHRLFVLLDSSGKGLQFGDVALLYLGQPPIEALSQALAEHLGELLHQIIGQIQLGMELTKQKLSLLLFNIQFFSLTKKSAGRWIARSAGRR